MTALFARILLKKHLNGQHWVALLLLTAGVILTQVFNFIFFINLMVEFINFLKLYIVECGERSVSQISDGGAVLFHLSLGGYECGLDQRLHRRL